MRRHGECRSECAGHWIRSVLLHERNRDIQIGINSCAAVTVFVHFRRFVTKSCKSCMDLSARKVKGKLRGVSFWFVNPRMAETCEVLMAVSEGDMSHDVFFPCHDEGTQACAFHEGCGTKLEPVSNGVFQLPVNLVVHNARTPGKNDNSGLFSSLSDVEQIEGRMVAIASSKFAQNA